MNDQRLGAALQAFHHERTRLPDPPELHARVSALRFDDMPQRRSWLPPMRAGFGPVFRATGIVLAGVIVALFGGFLLSGVLTQPQQDGAVLVGASASASVEPVPSLGPEPTHEATGRPETALDTDLLPGVELVSEVVEPGVLRILGDGVRELSMPLRVDGRHCAGYCFFDYQLDVKPDDGVWITGPEVAVRLGDETQLEPVEGVVDADGVVWALNDGRLETYEDSEWDLKARNVELYGIHPDGSLFMVRGTDPDRNSVGLIGPVSQDDWRDKAEVRSRLGIKVGGTGAIAIDPTSGGELSSYTGALFASGVGWVGWELSQDGAGATFPLTDVGAVMEFAYGPNGTSWRRISAQHMVAGEDGPGLVSTHFLTRVLPGGDPGGVSYQLPEPYDILAVAADGSVWLADRWHWPATEYEGLSHFDGETWTRYLHGLEVVDLDIAADGTIWVLVADVKPPIREAASWEEAHDQDGIVSVHVIQPEVGS